jgi:probable O-glycosylation ligase (exosortase A-associated)
VKGLIFTYLLTYGGAVVSLFNPFVGLLVYVCFAIVKPDAMWFWSVEPGNYSRIVAIGLLVGWAVRGFGNWHFGRARGMIVALIGLMLWSTLAATWALESEIAWNFVESLAKIVLPVVVGITTINSMDKLKQLAWVIVLSQGYVAFEFNLTYYQGYNRLYEEGFAYMDNNCNAIALVTGVGIAFFLGLSARSLWHKALAFLASLLMVNAIFFSYSRGGMLALVITGGFSFFLIPKRLVHYLVFAAAILVGFRLAGHEVIDRFQTVFSDASECDKSASSRLDLWKACLDSTWHEPMGLGPDQFPLVVDRYGYPRGKEAHSLWLQLGAELGIPGLLFLALYYGLCIYRLWPLTRESHPVNDPWERHFARMVIASLVGFAVAAQFVSLKLLESPYYVALIGAGVLKLTSMPRPALQAEPGPDPSAAAGPEPNPFGFYPGRGPSVWEGPPPAGSHGH